MFCLALKQLLTTKESKEELADITRDFANEMQIVMEDTWAEKLGLKAFDEELFNELMRLMIETSVDYTIFFRELSSISKDVETLSKSFYKDISSNEKMTERWSTWLEKWNNLLDISIDEQKDEVSKKMKSVNPKYTLREWFLVPAYEQANNGDYTLIKELQEVMSNPYEEQSKEIEEKYYQKKPSEFFDIAGISHVSCSS